MPYFDFVTSAPVNVENTATEAPDAAMEPDVVETTQGTTPERQTVQPEQEPLEEATATSTGNPTTSTTTGGLLDRCQLRRKRINRTRFP